MLREQRRRAVAAISPADRRAAREDARGRRPRLEPEEVPGLCAGHAGRDGACSRSCSATKRDLIVIHNMGASCPYCTLWADGFNGIYDHLADRAAFVALQPRSAVDAEGASPQAEAGAFRW